MNDSVLVRIFERLTNLLGDGQRFFQGQRTHDHPLGNRWSFDQFHHQPGLVGIHESVNGRNVWMVERGEDLGFALKPLDFLGIPCDVSWEDFDSYRPTQLAVPGAIDLTHPTNTELRDDFVSSQPSSRRKRHRTLLNELLNSNSANMKNSTDCSHSGGSFLVGGRREAPVAAYRAAIAP